MGKLDKLKACKSLSDLAILIGYKPRSLGHFIHQFPDSNKYKEFEIAKKSGGVRKISAPIDKLKAIQVRISDLLYDCIDEINKKKGITDSLSHGFRRGKSVFSNAAVHSGKRYVFNIDLQEFFPSINFGRVKGFFEKNSNFELAEPVALALAQLCCHEKSLPQGGPTSPVISNLIGHILDIRLAKLAERQGCSYSRYADDITFSTNKKKVPRAIAKKKICSDHEWYVGKDLRGCIERSGFTINSTKTRMQYHTSRQTVTGIVSNKGTNVPREYYKQSRAMCKNRFKTGTSYQFVKTTADDGSISTEQANVSIESLFGRLDHIFSARTFRKNLPTYSDFAKAAGLLSVYQKLVFFDYCIVNKMPTIICEGKTDIIYIKNALKNLYKAYPSLIKKSKGKFEYKIRFVRHSSRRARSIGIFDGADNLASFVQLFLRMDKKFEAPRTTSSTIIVTDNDNAVMKKGRLFDQVKGITGATCDGMKRSYKIKNGLYLVPVPKKLKSDQVIIEDLFKDADKQKDGRILSLEKSFDKTKFFDKVFFAEKVVKPNFDTIDFSAFKPFLDGIAKSIS